MVRTDSESAIDRLERRSAALLSGIRRGYDLRRDPAQGVLSRHVGLALQAQEGGWGDATSGSDCTFLAHSSVVTKVLGKVNVVLQKSASVRIPL